MAERCLTMGCPEAVRVALQDPCSGEATPGECNGHVLSCIRNWSIAPIVREGESSELVSDCGSMVIRSRQDDQLLGYTISFETAVRSNEFEALVTGREVIESEAISIGTYGVGSALSCANPSPDPRFFLEAFYKLSKCIDGANHVRVLLPMAQFKVTEIDREGTISFYRYTAETGISLANAIGDGPFLDLPADVATFLAARDAGEYTTGFDFEENITISGSCGCIEVPEAGPPEPEPCTFNIETVTTNDPANGVTITGTGFSTMNSVSFDIWDAPVAGAFLGGIDFFDPLGPNNATNIAQGNTISTWTDTLIIVSNNSGLPWTTFDGQYVRGTYGAGNYFPPCYQAFENAPGVLWQAD